MKKDNEKKDAMERLYKITLWVIAAIGAVSVASVAIKKLIEDAPVVWFVLNLASISLIEILPSYVVDVLTSYAKIAFVLTTVVNCLLLICPFWLMQTFHRRALRTPEKQFSKTWFSIEPYVFAVLVVLILCCWLGLVYFTLF